MKKIYLLIVVGIVMGLVGCGSSMPLTKDTKGNLHGGLYRGEFDGFKSMHYLESVVNSKELDSYIETCKILRPGDDGCQKGSDKPVLARITFSGGIASDAIIPAGMSLQNKDIVLEEETSKNVVAFAPRVISFIQHGENGSCKWVRPVKLMGGARVECANDKENGWFDNGNLMSKYPDDVIRPSK